MSETHEERTSVFSHSLVKVEDLKSGQSVENVMERVSHPSLESLTRLRDSGEVLRAQQGFDQFARAIECQTSAQSPEVEALWLQASRLSFETAIQSGQFDLAIDGLKQRFKRFQQPVWAELRSSTDHFYHDMIRLSIATGLDEQAFNLFERVRAQVKIPADLRVTLLDIAHRLNRFDAATARLCIDELASESEKNPEQTKRLFDILRSALCISPDTPGDDLLAELRALNLQVWKTAQQPWAVGHLAMGDWRLGNGQEALKWCHLRQSKNDPAETDLLIGAVFYLSHEWELARTRFGWASSKGVTEVRPEADAMRHLESLNNILERRGAGQSLEAFHKSVNAGLDAFRGTERHDGWRMDSDWVIGSALAATGSPDAAAPYFELAPLALARWRHLITAWDVLRSRQTSEQTGMWMDGLRAKQPVSASCLEVWQLILELRFEDAKRTLASVIGFHGDTLKNDPELSSVVTCLHAELALAGAEPTIDGSEVSEGFFEWRDQLQLRQFLERGEIDRSLQLASETTQHTAEPQRWRRLQAVIATWDESLEDSAQQILHELAATESCEPLDQLHDGLWLIARQKFEEAEVQLNRFANQFPECVECQLGLVECALYFGHSDEACMLLKKISQLSVWQNQFRWAWFRPWQRLLPQIGRVDNAVVAAPRLADVLKAVDLQLSIGQVDLVVETLGHFEYLLGAELQRFAGTVGERFNRVAALEARRGNWENACRNHQEASRRGIRNDLFVEAVAGSFESAPAAPDIVLEVLFAWMSDFAGNEQQFLESTPGRVFSSLVRISSEVEPESETEFDRRREWSNRFEAARPDWDDPKRSLLRSHVRHRDDEAAAAMTGSISHPTKDDQRLMARALWNLGRYNEAAAAFLIAGERAWGNCARAAQLFQEMVVHERWLTDEIVEPLLVELHGETEGEDVPPQLSLWTGAVLTACGRGRQALPHLERAVTSDPDQQIARRVLIGMAHLHDGATKQADELWGPPIPVDQLLEAPQRLVDWNLREAALWMLVHLQQPDDQELPQLGALIQQFRRLGDTSQLLGIVQAEFALRVGDLQMADEAVDAMAHKEPIASRDILLAPLCCLLRGERDFIRGRMQMQSGDFDAARQTMEQSAREQPWSSRAVYWQAMCEVRMGGIGKAEALLEKLYEMAPSNPAVSAQLAMIMLSKGNLQAADSYSQGALAINPAHGFALLVQAQLLELRSQTSKATETLRTLLACPDRHVHRRVRASAEMALGRLALQSGNLRESVAHFRSARRLAELESEPLRRLSVVLAAGAENEAESREADALLLQVAGVSDNDIVVSLALVVTADLLANTDAVAERLERVVASPQFQSLPSDVRHELAILSADTQLRQHRYAAAATALEQLLVDCPDDAVTERLRCCRLLQTMQLLEQRPLPQGAFQEMLHAAETVCEGSQPTSIAVLLKAIGMIFTGRCDSNENRVAVLSEVKNCTDGDHELRWLGTIVRYWLDDELPDDELGRLWAQPETGSLKRAVEVIKASQQRKPEGLREEAGRIAANGSGEQGVYDPEQVILVAALAAGTSRVDQAAALLNQWHEHGNASERTRTLLSMLLAKQAVKSLKQKKFGPTQKLLRDAIAAAT